MSLGSNSDKYELGDDGSDVAQSPNRSTYSPSHRNIPSIIAESPGSFDGKTGILEKSIYKGSPSSVQKGSPAVMQKGSPSFIMQKGSPSITQEGSPSVIMQKGSPSVMQKGSPYSMGKRSDSASMAKGSPSVMQQGSPYSKGKGSPSVSIRKDSPSINVGSQNRSPSSIGKGSPYSVGKTWYVTKAGDMSGANVSPPRPMTPHSSMSLLSTNQKPSAMRYQQHHSRSRSNSPSGKSGGSSFKASPTSDADDAREYARYRGITCGDRERYELSDLEYMDKIVDPVLRPLIQDISKQMPHCPATFIKYWTKNPPPLDIPLKSRRSYYDTVVAPVMHSICHEAIKKRPRNILVWLRKLMEDAEINYVEEAETKDKKYLHMQANNEEQICKLLGELVDRDDKPRVGGGNLGSFLSQVMRNSLREGFDFNTALDDADDVDDNSKHSLPKHPGTHTKDDHYGSSCSSSSANMDGTRGGQQPVSENMSAQQLSQMMIALSKQMLGEQGFNNVVGQHSNSSHSLSTDESDSRDPSHQYHGYPNHSHHDGSVASSGTRVDRRTATPPKDTVQEKIREKKRQMDKQSIIRPPSHLLSDFDSDEEKRKAPVATIKAGLVEEMAFAFNSADLRNKEERLEDEIFERERRDRMEGLRDEDDPTLAQEKNMLKKIRARQEEIQIEHQEREMQERGLSERETQDAFPEVYGTHQAELQGFHHQSESQRNHQRQTGSASTHLPNDPRELQKDLAIRASHVALQKLASVSSAKQTAGAEEEQRPKANYPSVRRGDAGESSDTDVREDEGELERLSSTGKVPSKEGADLADMMFNANMSFYGAESDREEARPISDLSSDSDEAKAHSAQLARGNLRTRNVSGSPNVATICRPSAVHRGSSPDKGPSSIDTRPSSTEKGSRFVRKSAEKKELLHISKESPQIDNRETRPREVRQNVSHLEQQIEILGNVSPVRSVSPARNRSRTEFNPFISDFISTEGVRSPKQKSSTIRRPSATKSSAKAIDVSRTKSPVTNISNTNPVGNRVKKNVPSTPVNTNVSSATPPNKKLIVETKSRSQKNESLDILLGFSRIPGLQEKR